VGRRQVAFAALAVGLVVTAAACTTPSSEAGPGSTTSTTLLQPNAGCYDNTVNTRSVDYRYSGIPNVEGNMAFIGSTDGTCSGPVNPNLASTLVLTAGIDSANTICLGLGGTGVSNQTWRQQGWTGLTDDSWVCGIPAPLGVVTTFAGDPTARGTADGTGSAARFDGPSGVAIDADGNAYVTDRRNNTVRKVTPGAVVTTLAGTPGLAGSADGTGSSARFNAPSGVAVDATGTLFVADAGNSTIRRITPAGEVTTIAGTAGQPGSADGTGPAARFDSPSGPAVDGSGNVLIADAANSTIRRINPAGEVTTIAGTAGQTGSADGTGPAARFANPAAVTVDGVGNIYVADSSNSAIRKITPTGVVTTLAGTSGNYGSTDGTGAAASFRSPNGIAVDRSGHLYVFDGFSAKVRRITPAGTVTTLAGSGDFGTADGFGPAASFTKGGTVAVDSSGTTVLVADYFASTIRKIT
jgi:sugar lactone lactonase YvrE